MPASRLAVATPVKDSILTAIPGTNELLFSARILGSQSTVGVRRSLLRSLLWLLALLACSASSSATDVALKGWVIVADSQLADTQPTIDDPRWRPFDPSRLTRPFATVTQSEPRSAWLMLKPASGYWPDLSLIVRIEHSGLQTISFPVANGEFREASLLQPSATRELAHGALGFSVHGRAGNDQPLLLRIDGTNVIASPIRFRVLDSGTHRHVDASWLTLAASSLTVMLAMGLMALVFALYLRDVTFLHYAGYVVSYALILCLQSGFVAAPLGLSFDTESAALTGRILTATSVVFAVLFLDRFAGLRRHAPRWRFALMGLALSIVMVSALSMIPVSPIASLGRSLTNPLLILGGPLLLAGAIAAAVRGSTYAWVFLVGWLPLLVVTVLGSIQLYGPFADWTWLHDAALVAGAYEALVLSLGLARRSLDLRRERDAVRRLADLDPLTGLLNRRAWVQQVEPLATSTPQRSLCLLFIDADHFKTINDRHGHDTGDQVLLRLAGHLRAELGSRDLLARYGGEELVAALPNCGLERAKRIAERIRRHVEGIDFWPATDEPHEPLHLSVSIGIACLGEGETLESLIHRADQAMYFAKSEGRNRVALLPASAN